MSLLRRRRFFGGIDVTPEAIEDELTYIADQAVAEVEKGQIGGVPSLDVNGKIPEDQLPDKVLAFLRTLGYS